MQRTLRLRRHSRPKLGVKRLATTMFLSRVLAKSLGLHKAVVPCNHNHQASLTITESDRNSFHYCKHAALVTRNKPWNLPSGSTWLLSAHCFARSARHVRARLHMPCPETDAEGLHTPMVCVKTGGPGSQIIAFPLVSLQI